MPFEYWEDNYTKRIRRKRNNKDADDREGYFFSRCVHQKPGWPYKYHLPPPGVNMMKSQGPFLGKYRDCEGMCGIHEGRNAHIFCPGPSVEGLDFSKFFGKLTFSVNSAGFLFPTNYWVIAESSYAKWFVKQEAPWGSVMLLTARAAVCFRQEEKDLCRTLMAWAWIIRWEEELIIPCRAPSGASVMNALVSAWQMGCPRAFIYGLDLGKQNGPYVSGVPHTREGERRSYDEQIRTLDQFSLPGFEVVNMSPVNKVKRFSNEDNQ